eukprot:scaffold844_cov268-Chaetoceros_neogracile.AAC.6
MALIMAGVGLSSLMTYFRTKIAPLQLDVEIGGLFDGRRDFGHDFRWRDDLEEVNVVYEVWSGPRRVIVNI